MIILLLRDQLCSYPHVDCIDRNAQYFFPVVRNRRGLRTRLKFPVSAKAKQIYWHTWDIGLTNIIAMVQHYFP